MRTVIEIRGTTIRVVTSIDMEFPAFTDSLHISAGPFGLTFLYPETRKSLIAALIEADKELDAAAEARKENAA